ncbi:menaquinone-dependent protoporphyrinogen IX dehydrogenase [Candidatus Erwinia haradaeae]|uniref:Protoporphyrinogen IX dehydrogenase [quinone] n=1 Tax=Candidatus Erwinia haradaeae TaxID=1922217 RepID=A0A451D2H5_9GAMM|nr:menaquinone-dependent protoporphyrinogen IX dehydrogenase [Candidatus Erwinia haradaeae]VFP79826.1 Protoporphyrinogen IX dehydrogenase [menaquinone] [Candidatus Erwinia haradaeae]
MKTLILFSSRHDQTKKIATYIANILKNELECYIQNIQNISYINWSQYDRVLIGASIYYGHFSSVFEKFIKTHFHFLNQIMSGFFSVNLLARKLEKSTPFTNPYMRKFLLRSQWKPNCCAVFSGALCYARYNFFDCMMIKLIMYITKGETNGNRKIIEYTDWQKVSVFAHEFIQLQKNKI